MRRVIKNFLNGVLTFVPIFIVIYVLVKVFTFADNLLGNYLRPYLKETYIPGVGIIATVILITVLGWLSSQYISSHLVRFIDRLFGRIPLVKSLYSITKETIESFLGEKKSFSKVVLVKLPGTEMKVIGFLTADSVEEFCSDLLGHVAVYVPQAFQMAGLTLFIPREDIQVLDVKAEDAMKMLLSGGMTGAKP